MLDKTEGIILHQIRYTDSGIIARFYTRKFGRISFLIKGMRNRKAGKHNVFFQPLFILNLEMNYKESRELQILREFSPSLTPLNIHSNVKKGCVAIFLGEVLDSVLKEESPNEELFDYIKESIGFFDSCSENYANFHIAFLVGLSSFLGFEPSPRLSNDDRFFDLRNGIFVPVPPTHNHFASEKISDILADFFVASYDTIKNISLNGTQRNEVIETILKFYTLHFAGLKRINSLEVLKEVFSS
jgi:DNA repair protein RecO (recombination protein O)